MYAMETLIFFDLETTGLTNDAPNDPLFSANKSNETPGERTRRMETIVRLDGQKMPRLTEMSFVSVPRQLFATAAKQMRSVLSATAMDEECAFEYVTVATNVHTRQLNPQLSEREWEIYENDRRRNACIHLTKSDLERKNKFWEEWPGVVQFLEVCPKPACLIAHNGIKFDFRLLFHELRRAKTAALIGGLEMLPPIPDNVFFLDSLSTFLEIEMHYNREMELTTQNIDWNFVFAQTRYQSHSQEEEKEPSVELANANPVNQLVVVHSTTTTLIDASTTREDDREQQLVQELGRANKFERVQKTPERKFQRETMGQQKEGVGIIKRGAKRTLPFSQSEQHHPIKFMRTQGWSPAKQRRINPKFFMRNSQTGDWRFDGQMARRDLLSKGTFRLESLHNRLFSTTPYFSHRAQADCDALLQVCMTYGDDFLTNMDKNASAFPLCYKTMGISNGNPNPT